ncbi:hypothetical protein F5B22DRAFT_401348 [Xylaria bambusicola]|uniref:uncharacterized protein n=1 Tax=Xylaria bambusicola TaxID=326684 RepID=UPI002007777C|nr:uncharacterized protein F5B22DRAFT_401348 [Xylaria bambusicola]KAI0508349.1 hypothetical protein F5B22DRAFT_401348 [Xylaria bambusicola]
MLSRSVRLSQRALSGRAQTLAPIAQRHYAESHFPGAKVESLGHSQIWKVSEAIKEDHKQLKDYYHRAVNSKDPDEQERYGNAFIWELARHSIAEELVVYPAFERDVQDGQNIADNDRDQHQTIKEQLYEFQKLKPRDEAYVPTLQSLFKNLETHIKEEEEDHLVKLENSLSLTESKELSQSFERTKMFTPTRSHPSAPNKRPFETVVGLMTAPVDKLRDLLFTKFPEKKMPDIGHMEHGVGKSDR